VLPPCQRGPIRSAAIDLNLTVFAGHIIHYRHIFPEIFLEIFLESFPAFFRCIV
jgi:hypothetical protein